MSAAHQANPVQAMRIVALSPGECGMLASLLRAYTRRKDDDRFAAFVEAMGPLPDVLEQAPTVSTSSPLGDITAAAAKAISARMVPRGGKHAQG